MTVPSDESFARPPESLPRRLMLGFFGLVAAGVGVLMTVGAGLGGLATVGIAGFLLGRKGKTLTRTEAWIASAGGTIAVVAVLFAISIVITSRGDLPKQTPAERTAQRAKAREAMPGWLKTRAPATEQQAAIADSMTERLLENKSVVMWAGVFGAVLFSSLIGGIAGTFIWGGVMLLYRAVRGDWLPSKRAPAAAS